VLRILKFSNQTFSFSRTYASPRRDYPVIAACGKSQAAVGLLNTHTSANPVSSFHMCVARPRPDPDPDPDLDLTLTLTLHTFSPSRFADSAGTSRHKDC
jgi:hypothetical protein